MKIYGYSSPFFFNCEWMTKFKHDCKNVQDESCEGHMKSAVTL